MAVSGERNNEKMTLVIGPDKSGKAVAISGDRIVAPDAAAAATTLDASEAAIEPVRVNAHTHLYSALAPFGMPAPDLPPENFVQILERIWWRLDRALDERSLRASARLYVAEALLAGTGALIDHHESPALIDGSLDILAEACEELGIRAVLTYGATERNDGKAEARAGLDECERFLRRTARSGLVRGVIGLHASFTVSDDTIRDAGERCRSLGTVMHVHVAEDGADVEDARKRGYAGPLERLLTLLALPPGSILAHGVHLDREQVRAAAEAGLWLVQNPRSNKNNRVGYPRALVETDRVALGTDGFPARMDEEASALVEEAKAHGESVTTAWRRTTRGHDIVGERLGVSIGSVEPGAAADLAVVSRGRIRHVVVAGRVVVKDGELMTGDIEEIRAKAKEAAPQLFDRMRAL